MPVVSAKAKAHKAKYMLGWKARKSTDAAYMEKSRKRHNACHRTSQSITKRREWVWQHAGLKNMTEIRYQEMLLAQDNGCAICHRPCRTGRRLSVDHDHETGEVRGLLCRFCNIALGHLKDDPALLRTATEYLEIRRSK